MIDAAEYAIPDDHVQEHPPPRVPRTYQEPARKKAAERIGVACTQCEIPP
jgi:hypothetical protein